MTTRNRHGAELGPNGYIICRKCLKETDDISTDTPAAYAYCMDHRPWNRTKQERDEALEIKSRDNLEPQGGLF